MTSDQFQFVVNARANRVGNVSQIETMIRKYFPRASIVHSISRSDVKSLKDTGATCFVAVGGDGTAHRLLNSLTLAESTTFAVLSRGTGNDIARSLGLHWRRLEPAIVQLLRSQPGRIDLGMANKTRFLTSCGVGLPAEVVLRTRKRSLRRFSFGFAAWAALGKARPFSVEVGWEEGKSETEAVALLAANMRSTGGGLVFSPDARFDDGLLDLAVIESSVDRWTLLRYLPSLVSGRPIRDPRVRHLRSSFFEVNTDPPMPWVCDGEPAGEGHLELTCQPGVLRMFLPVQ